LSSITQKYNSKHSITENKLNCISFEYILFLKIITLAPLILILVLQVTTFSNEIDSNYAYALNNIMLDDFNIAATGDWGCTGNAKNTVNNIIDKNPELVLGLGDYAYRNDAKCWLKMIDPIDHKMKIVIGNHDAKQYINGTYYPAPERLQQYMDHFNLSKQFYSFNYQNIHFIAMSTEVPYALGSKQYSFVESDLKKTVTDPNIDWIVVFYHRLAYTSPSKVGPMLKFRDTYHPLFEKYGVDLVIQAHNHNYQRSYPIKYNAENSSNPLITNNNTTDYYDPTGQIFTIVGTGGVSFIHNFTAPPAAYTAVQFKGIGFLNLNILHNGSTLVGEFYYNDGTIKDRFSITKSNNKESNLLSSSQNKPKLMNDFDSKFKIDTIFKGLRWPTDMAFLDPNDIIVLEKNNGTVQRVVNGQLLEKPLLDVNVSNKVERGLLGTAISKATDNSVYVFLYYTETDKEASDICPKPNYCLPGTEPIGNRLYRYELTQDGTKLINPKLLLDLPAIPGPGHNGGKMIIGHDKSIFLVIGDVMGDKAKAQNFEDGQESNIIGGVLRVDQEGHPLDHGYLGSKYPLNLYYAYGIRNSFGIDFDPRTGDLWDTENGPGFGDEINLVKPGFNSGWKDVQGIWQHKNGKPQNVTLSPDNLEDFDGKGIYRNPELTFFNPVGITAIKFFNSDKMGPEYKDDLFVGDINNGKIFHFDLNDDRTSLVLDGELADKIANSPDDLEEVTFAEGFSGITDLDVGLDGYLYVLSYGKGTIYKISPK